MENADVDSSEIEHFGIDLNVYRENDDYIVEGNFAENTYIGDGLSEFIGNIKDELRFIADYGLGDSIGSVLSESQLGVYLDEKVNDMGTAYAVSGFID